MDIVNLQSDEDIVHRTCKDLSSQVFDGLEIMPLVSDLWSLLLQVFLEFALQFPIISFQASHPLQVEGQVVIQTLNGLLLALDAPYDCQTPSHPHSQAPIFPATLLAGGVGHGDPGA